MLHAQSAITVINYHGEDWLERERKVKTACNVSVSPRPTESSLGNVRVARYPCRLTKDYMKFRLRLQASFRPPPPPPPPPPTHTPTLHTQHLPPPRWLDKGHLHYECAVLAKKARWSRLCQEDHIKMQTVPAHTGPSEVQTRLLRLWRCRSGHARFCRDNQGTFSKLEFWGCCFFLSLLSLSLSLFLLLVFWCNEPFTNHPSTHTRTYIHTHTRTRARAHTHTHTHARTHALTHARTHARTHAHTYAHKADARTRTHTLAYARTHTHTHTHTPSPSYPPPPPPPPPPTHPNIFTDPSTPWLLPVSNKTYEYVPYALVLNPVRLTGC